MRRSQKSKRVTWASDVNLCQVRLFLSEESPSQVGTGTQDHLQAKILWPVESGGTGSDDNLPPGFEGIQPANLWSVKLSQIPLLKWKCPPRFEVNSNWQVVAGEDSTETEAQDQREMRVLEAIYPRASAIPPNPSALVGVEDSVNNDQNTPLVPITPIEDEDTSLDSSFVSTAAQAALTSVVSNNDPGTLIDHDLLMKILSNPKMFGQLVPSHGASSCAQNVPSSSTHNMVSSFGMQNATSFSTQNLPTSHMHNNMPSPSKQYTPDLRPMSNSVNMAINRTRPELIAPSMSTAPGPFYPTSGIGFKHNLRPSVPDVIPAPSSSVGVPLPKDINYYKSLIQQHGGERREVLPQFTHQSSNQPWTSPEPSNSTNPRDSKPKIMKPCIYFNSPRGCRNGANCAYQHDMSSQQRVSGVPDVQTLQSAKRVKLDREITGT
ncbi:hypothetical protein RD792_012331 [Penstemon davidsonii]|uniref:C3H1-type domain-containing protein n=1 Tax=Penstemon davidsonii TaxID=160366 RepID=A0ABR0CXF1_9LAMI|nr:hypothetical protein RD792_012331 [Penstemon davidsonii]